MNNQLPLVSVAIITYNQKEYLKECIESILEQDYDNIEIVVADDCSTDGTQEMLEEYDRKYPNKFVLKLSDKNQGITKNCNLAHFACSGKYIAWMGGDDLMLPGKIRKQVEYMEENPNCYILHHNLEVFDSHDNRHMFYLANNQKVLRGNLRTMVKYGTFNGATATMIRTAKAPKHGFDERIPIASDWLYWIDTLLDEEGTIEYLDEVLGKYRRHSNNITNRINYVFNNEIDHLNSCNIILTKKPSLKNEVIFRSSEILRGLRKNEENYLNYLWISFKVGFNIKSLILLVIYYLSLGKVQK